MPSPPSTRPSGSRGRRSSAFAREDSGTPSRSAVSRLAFTMTPISRGFGGRRRDDVDPSLILPGQYRGWARGCSFEADPRAQPGQRRLSQLALAVAYASDIEVPQPGPG